MKLQKIHIVLLLIGALLIGFAGGYAGMKFAQPDTGGTEDITSGEKKESGGPSSALPAHMAKIAQAFALIQENYIEDVEDEQLIEGAIDGMLATLEDPHSSYMDVEVMQQFNEQIESSFEGIGAEVSMINGVVTIVAPIKNSPAEKAGLRPNDQVLSVDGESLEGLNLNEAVAKIRGEKGTTVVLELVRQGVSEPFEVSIVRDEIPVETVYHQIEEVDGKKTGILEITNFSENTFKEFEEQLNMLEEEGIEGLVIDVRGNPGGLLNVIEDILGLFVPKDML